MMCDGTVCVTGVWYGRVVVTVCVHVWTGVCCVDCVSGVRAVVAVVAVWIRCGLMGDVCRCFCGVSCVVLVRVLGWGKCWGGACVSASCVVPPPPECARSFSFFFFRLAGCWCVLVYWMLDWILMFSGLCSVCSVLDAGELWTEGWAVFWI